MEFCVGKEDATDDRSGGTHSIAAPGGTTDACERATPSLMPTTTPQKMRGYQRGKAHPKRERQRAGGDCKECTGEEWGRGTGQEQQRTTEKSLCTRAKAQTES